MPTKMKSDDFDPSGLKGLVKLTRVTVENSVDYASILIKEKNYEEAKIYLQNALEGIEILTA